MRIVYRSDAADVECVGPDGVVSHIGFRRRHDDVVVISYLLAFLRIAVIVVSILEGKDSVGTVCNTLDDEMAAAVGTRDAEERTGAENGIGPLRIAVAVWIYTTV